MGGRAAPQRENSLTTMVERDLWELEDPQWRLLGVTFVSFKNCPKWRVRILQHSLLFIIVARPGVLRCGEGQGARANAGQKASMLHKLIVLKCFICSSR
jgi:hypothetical protein